MTITDWIFIGIVFINLFAWLIDYIIHDIKYKGIEKGYSIIYKKRKLLRVIFLIELTVINVIFSFLPPCLNLTWLILVGLTILSILLFFKNLIDQKFKDNYVFELQKNCSKNTLITDIFEIKKEKTEYKEQIKDESCKFRKIKKEGNICIVCRIQNEQFTFTPLHNLSSNQVDYFCEKMNIEFDNIISIEELRTKKIYCFSNINLYDYKNQIEYNDSNFTKWYNIYCKKLKNLLTILIYGLLILFLIFIGICLYNPNLEEIIIGWLYSLHQ